jgi:tetratricopeptide (TPR) repeat protein
MGAAPATADGGAGSARTRVAAIVAGIALVVVAAVVGVTLLQSRGEGTGPTARAGAPPLWLDFGVRQDPEARALVQAQSLYNAGHRQQAAAIFARYHSLDAELGAAFAAWPKHSLDDVKHLVASHPVSALAELHLGWALYWSGRDADALAAWRRAAALGPDSAAGVDAETALHPAMFPGLPYIIVPYSPPADVAALPAARELQALARAAARPDEQAKLLYGVALWNLKRPRSAERQFAAAAALAPDDPIALTAAGVGAFTKDDPVHAFARVGPLTGRFPHASVVRFHLGLLLLWTRQVQKARVQLRLATVDEPGSTYAKQARRLLSSLPKNGTK